MKPSRALIIFAFMLVDPCQATNPLEWIATAILKLFVGEEALKSACDGLIAFLGVNDFADLYCDCTAKADLWLGILPVGIQADAFCDSRDQGLRGLGCFAPGQFTPSNIQFCCKSMNIKIHPSNFFSK